MPGAGGGDKGGVKERLDERIEGEGVGIDAAVVFGVEFIQRDGYTVKMSEVAEFESVCCEYHAMYFAIIGVKSGAMAWFAGQAEVGVCFHFAN